MRKFIQIFEAKREIDWNARWNKIYNYCREVESKKKLSAPGKEQLRIINAAREIIRHMEGLGGQCHEVSEFIENIWGWERVSGTYCNDDGEPVCAFHFWNMLPDGTVLDSTPDQFCEDSRRIRIISPTSRAWKRYTCEWMEDWHPGHPDYNSEWDQEKRDPSKYSGEVDHDRKTSLIHQHRDDYWHVRADKRHHIDNYHKKLARYGDSTPYHYYKPKA